MPKVFRQQYTKPIPDGAERYETTGKGRLKLDADGQPIPLTVEVLRRGKAIEVPAVRFKGQDGRAVTAPIVEKGKGAGTHCRVYSPTYYGLVDGEKVPLKRTKAASEEMLELLLSQATDKRHHLPQHRQHAKRPLAEHLDDFRVHLEGKGDRPRHVSQTVGMVQALFDGTGAVRSGDLDADAAQRWLATLRKGASAELPAGQEKFTVKEVAALLGVKPDSVSPLVKRRRLAAEGNGRKRRLPRATVETLLADRAKGAGPQTVNHYVRAVRSFCAWMMEGKRMADNPFAALPLLPVDDDVRRRRRELTPAELRHLLTVTRQSEKVFRGLTGEDRFHLYACACGTGFRAGGIGGLTPSCFDLDEKRPKITLPAKFSKSRKVKVQPLKEDVATLMRAYLEGKSAGEAVWPGTWARDRKGAEMLRIDLDAAGIPYAVEGPEGPLYADFHALRHSYLTALGKEGVDMRTVQKLAGHSTMKLTENYSHRRDDDLADAVDRLPSFLPGEGQPLPAPYPSLTEVPDSSRVLGSAGEGKAPETIRPSPAHKPSSGEDLEGKRGPVSATEQGWLRGLEPPTSRATVGASEVASSEENRSCDAPEPALTRPLAEMPPDLARVVAAWHDLPAHVRGAVLMLLDGSKK